MNTPVLDLELLRIDRELGILCGPLPAGPEQRLSSSNGVFAQVFGGNQPNTPLCHLRAARTQIRAALTCLADIALQNSTLEFYQAEH